VGLFTGLLLLPLAPVRGVAWLGEQLQEQALRTWADPTLVRQELDDVQRRWEAGEIDDGQRAELEDALLERLRAGQQIGGGL
jgi:hypothetical protein